jgi:HK97 family phage major capsid protein
MTKQTPSSGLISKTTLLSEVRLLLSKGEFTHQDSARVNGLLSLAQQLGPNGGTDARSDQSRESRAFAQFLRTGSSAAEARDMGVGTGTSGGYLVPQGFRATLAESMKAFDKLFDERFVTFMKGGSGAPMLVPASDDSSAAAVAVPEGTAEPAEVDPHLQQITLPSAPMYRTGPVRVSLELLQDAAFDVSSYLAGIFAKRLARGISPVLTTAFAAAVPASVTATGSSTNTGGSETGGHSIGSDDIFALMSAVDSEYLSSEKVGFLMSWPTLLSLWKLRDKNGRPIFATDFDDDGTPLLLGFPVGICPSLPAIAPNAVPLYFGDLSFWLTRIVLDGATIAVDREMRAEFGQVIFRGLLRGNGTMLLNSSSTTVPIVGLKNAATTTTAATAKHAKN